MSYERNVFWTKTKDKNISNKRYKEDSLNRKRNLKFYLSKEWRRLRQYILSVEPLCRRGSKEGIITEATQIDHIISINKNYSLRLSLDNCQPLCDRCHAQKTNEERRGISKEEQEIVIDETMNDLESHLHNTNIVDNIIMINILHII